MNRKRFGTESKLITWTGGAAQEVLSSWFELAGKADWEVLGSERETQTQHSALRTQNSFPVSLYSQGIGE